jgi:hypothetical protein
LTLGPRWSAIAGMGTHNGINTELRPATDLPDFPYKSTSVPFVMIKDGAIRWAKNPPAKRELCREDGGTLLAIWPGEYSSDVVEVSDRTAALAAL